MQLFFHEQKKERKGVMHDDDWWVWPSKLYGEKTFRPLWGAYDDDGKAQIPMMGFFFFGVSEKCVCVWNTMVRPKVDWWYKRLQEAITWGSFDTARFFWDHDMNMMSL